MLASRMESFEDINYSDIEIIEVVGKGSFGVVSKGRWHNQDVAVKTIGSETEKKAFRIELKQLSRVKHTNIVKLIGACQEKVVCLVMEYAEGGSLYNVLHGNPQPEYTAAHAISWVLQCARGVAYLHGMKPKALVHRDLKPPNLLLINGGTVLKICDFGTACDIHTHMTNNKGSAAWMAPEVFEGSSYSEKCDVFSWGIILWEVLSRQKPFDDIRGSAYQILWAVHSGKRPPPIRGCPEPLDIVMKNCWNKEPHYRPSMEELVNMMEELSGFFKGAEEAIRYPPLTEGTLGDDDDDEDYDSENDAELSEFDSREVTCGSECPSQVALETTSGSDQSAGKDAELNQRSSTETLNALSSSSIPSYISRLIQSSAPASLASSKEDIQSELERTLSSGYPSSKDVGPNQKRLSADIASLLKPATKPHGHQRSGSYGSNFVINTGVVEPKGEEKRRNSEDMSRPRTQDPAANPAYPPDVVLQPKAPNFNLNTIGRPVGAVGSAWPPTTAPGPPPALEPTADTIKYTYLLLEPHLQPLSPYQGSRESLKIFEDHKKMAYKYLRINKEYSILKQRKNELDNHLNNYHAHEMMDNQPDGNVIINEYDNLIKEKESLKKLYENLQQQLAISRDQQKRE